MVNGLCNFKTKISSYIFETFISDFILQILFIFDFSLVVLCNSTKILSYLVLYFSPFICKSLYAFILLILDFLWYYSTCSTTSYHNLFTIYYFVNMSNSLTPWKTIFFCIYLSTNMLLKESNMSVFVSFENL